MTDLTGNVIHYRFLDKTPVGRLLLAADDPRAADVLTNAYTRLQTWAGYIGNVAWRHTFLNDVPEHREMVCLYGEIPALS